MQRSTDSAPILGREPIPFGKYLLLERISVGGMAEVFKAKTFGVGGFEKVVAVKRILPSLADDAEFIEMFVDEAKICGQLQHANIGQVYELGRVDETHFIAMEFVWGRDLLQVGNRLRKHKQLIDPRLAALMAAEACDGLDYAHRKKDQSGRWLQIIHRDISPQNLLVSFDGEVKIVDFGIAKAALRSSKTQAGVLKGKFGYMSPEQVRGLPIDRRSDIFALGIILWELLTNEKLFTGETDFETLERVKNGAIPPPSSKNPRVGKTLDAIVNKALARGVEDRYAWASEMREALLHHVHEGEGAISAKHLAGFMRELYAAELDRSAQLAASKPAPPTSGRSGQVVAPQREGEMRTVEMPAPVFDEPTTVQGGSDHVTSIVDADEIEALAAQPQAPEDPTPPSGTPVDLESMLFEDETAKRGKPKIQKAPKQPPTFPTDVPAPPSISTSMSTSTPRNPDRLDKPTVQTEPARRPAPSRNEAPTVMRPAPQLPPTGPAPMPVEIPLASNRTTGAIPTIPPKGTLVRDLGIGALLALVVLGAFVGGQAWYSRRGGGQGTLVVMAQGQDAYEVEIDGRAVGRVDGSHHLTLKDLPPGPHQIQVRSKEGPRFSHTVDVQPRDVTVFSAAAAPAAGEPARTGKLRLQVNAKGAKIEVDGALLSDSGTDQPIALRASTPHEVRVRKAGYRDIVLNVTLSPGEELVKEVDFPATPAFARVEVSTDPPGADVYLDSKKRGVSPLVLDSLDPAKPARITLKRRGYHSTTKQVELGALDVKLDVKLVAQAEGAAEPTGSLAVGDDAPGTPKPMPAPLHPDAPITPKSMEDEEPKESKNPNEPGYLIANTQPWARVFIDGKDTGKTTPIPPRSRIVLRPGKHVVGFVVANRKYNFNVLIRPGEETRLLEQLGDE